MMDNLTKSFQISALCIAMSCVSSATFAIESLEALDDYSLAESTGEGIALLPTDAFMVFQGAGPNPATNEAVLTDRTKDTGYIRYVPVGPLTSTAAASGAGKADIFLYGTAISKADNNINNRIANTIQAASIKSWGTPVNPWILRVDSQGDVPDFLTTSSTNPPGGITAGTVSYLTLEAPLYDTTLPLTAETGADAYKLKLGMWADIFVRDPNFVEGATSTGNASNNKDAGLTNRLRLQAIWDGFSLNGSNIKLFQTLGGVGLSGDVGVNQGMSKFYNNTLGMSGLFRLNSGNSNNVKATYTVSNPSNVATGWSAIPTNAATFGSGCGNSSADMSDERCRFRTQTRTVTHSTTGATWVAPTVKNVLRFSTRESGTGDGILNTPAINGTNAPTFDATEGLYLYHPNINLVLGSLYQPLTFGSDGKNFSMEIARIPNKESIYKKIYTNYDDSNANTNGGYYGSTCNVFQCGTSTIAGLQGNTATHSSISIGSVTHDAATNTLNAVKDSGAIGVSFNQLANKTLPAGTMTYTELQYQMRNVRSRQFTFTDRYRIRAGNLLTSDVADPYNTGFMCETAFAGRNCDRVVNRTGVHLDWEYLTGFDVNGQPVYGMATDGYVIYKAGATAAELLKNYTTTAPTGTGYTAATLNGRPATNVGTTSAAWNSQSYAPGIVDCPSGTNAWAEGTCVGTSGDGDYRGIGSPNREMTASVRNWTATARTNLPWFKAKEGDAVALLYQKYNPTALIREAPANVTLNYQASPDNNFGSAVIDGMLIQHMKITTKGL